MIGARVIILRAPQTGRLVQGFGYMTLSASLRESGLLGFTFQGGAVARLATPKVGFNSPAGPTPPGAGGAGGGDTDTGTGGAGGAYNATAQNGATTSNGATGGGGGGDGEFSNQGGLQGVGSANGGAGAAFNGGAGGTGGIAAMAANGGNGGAGQAAGAGTGGSGGGGGGGDGNLAVVSNVSTLSLAVDTIGFNGGNGGAGIGPNAGGGGGGAGGFGALTDHATAVTLGAFTVQGGNGGAGGAGSNGGLTGAGGSGGFGFGFNAGAASSLTIAAGGSVVGGAGGSGSTGGVGGAGVYELDTSFTLTNAGTIAGGAGGAATPFSALGGVGVTGGALTITNTGTISAGAGGFFTAADAIAFTSGANHLTLSSGGVTGTINGDIGVTGSLQIDPGAASVTLSNVIHGTGSVEKIDADTLILTGADTYSGGTTVTAGVLQIGTGGTVGSITGNVVDNATLAFDRSDSQTFGGVISGTGALQQIGVGALILTGTNTYSGGTTITAGVLQIGAGGTTGSIAGNVVDNATLAFDRSNSPTFAGVISGTGAVHTLGIGDYTLSGANTYSGGTTISAGGIQATNSTVSGGVETSSSIGTGTVTFDGGLLLMGSNNLTFANAAQVNATGGGFDLSSKTVTWNGAITDGSGPGALTIEDPGTLVLGHANTFSGGLIVESSARVEFANTSALGSHDITLNGGQLYGTTSGLTITNNITLNNYGRLDGVGAHFTGAITGGGGLIIEDGASVYISNATHTGQTYLSDGSTLIAGAANAFSSQSYVLTDGDSIINLNGYSQTIAALDSDGYSSGFVKNTGGSAVTLAIGDAGDSTNYGGTIEDGGAGSLAIVKQGLSQLELYGVNTYSGGTTLSGGTLELNAATTVASGHITSGAAGTGAITFAGAAILRLDAPTIDQTAGATHGETYYTISGFAAGDTIDVRDAAGSVDTATYNASLGTLTLTNGGTTEAILHIGTAYAGYTFNAAYDSHGGTDITVTAPAPSGGGGGGGTTTPPAADQTGTGGADTLTAGAGASTVSGGAGDDHINGGAGSAVLYGNTGNDTITLFSYTGGSTVYGGQGDDHVDASGSTQANFISGDLGNDSITLGSGADTAYGGVGNDSIIAGSGHDQLYGNAGNDQITIGAANTGSTVYAGQGDDHIDASGSTHANFISGDLGNDSITLGSGADTAYAGDGNDSIVAGSGHDQLYGNAGNDLITLGASNAGSTVYAGQGNDHIDASGSTHANYLSGDVGNDVILGGTSTDTIHGGVGSDTIQSAAGATEQIHVGTADSSALAGAGQTQLDHVLGFGSGDKLVFDGDVAGTASNTLTHAADASIANFATAYAYAYGDGTHAGAISGAVEYVIVDDTAGHTYVFAADHAAVEIDGLTGGANSVTAGQLLAA